MRILLGCLKKTKTDSTNKGNKRIYPPMAISNCNPIRKAFKINKKIDSSVFAVNELSWVRKSIKR